MGYGFRPWRVGGLISYAEDVMDGQVARGHEVAYFFRGRHYPGLRDDRLRRWARRGVQMYEILNSTLVFGGDTGTLTPEADLNHPASEAHFTKVLDAFAPDVIHLQEVIGLPTAVLDIARARAVPVLATLQDYLPLCPVLKLFDVDGQICVRPDVGEQCARCSATAPADRKAFASTTAHYELRRRLGTARALAATDGLARARRLARRLRGGPSAAPSPGLPRERSASARSYQARRDINVERLNGLSAALAQSRRVAEIYAQLGVDPTRIRVLQLTLGHLEAIAPRTIVEPPAPVRFATVNGAASVEKGAEVLLGALSLLHEAGLAGSFVLKVLGYVPPDAWRRLRRFSSVEISGWYEPGDLDGLLGDVDVGLMPSVWEEAYGYVGPELLAKGIPVIGNARGGIVDYTRDGQTGWVNRDADAAGLAAIMQNLIRRPGQIVDRHRWIVEHRHELIKPLDRHLDELEAVYEEVLAQAGYEESALRRAVRPG